MVRKLYIALLAVMLLGCYSAQAQYNKDYFFYIGRGFIIDNKYDEAIESLNVLLRVDPNAYEGYFLRGIAKYNLDDLLGAEMDFTTAISKNPVFTTAYQYRAITRSRLGNYDDALGDFREAIELRPDLPGPYYSRGVTYFLSQQFDKAIKDFDQFIRYENRVADAYINRGTCYLYLKDTTRAYEEYNTAIKTNRENPNGYNRRGTLLMSQKRYNLAMEDFNKAIECDTSYVLSYFNRAIVHSSTNNPMGALSDFDKVIEIDSTNSLTYFNRAIVRSDIGDYNRALEDYNKVAMYSPGNVLVYFNRALLYQRLGDIEGAINDYSKAIELYPDFATAYLSRSRLRMLLKDPKGARNDKQIADRKIAEYKTKVSDSTFSIYADTSRKFNQLLAFDAKLSGGNFEKIGKGEAISLQPLFKFNLVATETSKTLAPKSYYLHQIDEFIAEIGEKNMKFTTVDCNISPDSLVAMDRALSEDLAHSATWQTLFKKGLTQSLIRQYTNSVNSYSTAIERNPTNPFLYINRSTTRSEMIDFISSIDNNYERITVDSDPVNRLKNRSTRVYNYDEAIADLNKAAKLMPENAYIYYNRANLLALSGKLPEAFDDYSLAIKLNPMFAEAYYNRGLTQIYMKDLRKGCLDVSKAGELGIKEAYTVLKRYSNN